MKKIILNEHPQKYSLEGDYTLDPTEKYVIDLEKETEFQMAILAAFQIMGPPPALKNYHAWLFDNGFNVDAPNPTNEVVASYYALNRFGKPHTRKALL